LRERALQRLDESMTIALRYSIHTLLITAAQATTLFGSAGRADILEFWLYLAVLLSFLALPPMFLDPDLIRERVQPGGRSVGLRFLPLLIFVFLHWLLAGLDRGRLHLSDTVPSVLEAAALVLFVAAWILCVWAMHINPFFSSTPRIQWERGHRVISDGPYRVIQHPGRHRRQHIGNSCDRRRHGLWRSYGSGVIVVTARCFRDRGSHN
jgi:hypothetical protein